MSIFVMIFCCQISFSPLFIIKNYLPRTIQLSAVSVSGDVTAIHDVPGESMERQLFDLPPDSWHYVTFKLPGAKVSSNPSVPLNTTLHELTDKVRQGDGNEESQNLKWPYSSNSWKTQDSCYTAAAKFLSEIIDKLHVLLHSF